ncbi:MAG: S-methyl-5'-thioadenosine phosphorylase [Candidatus Aenigmarchaeota archaeon ex4484_56]|nr:MAG: S-methyl-5'-thioadenosine phosphorylase [Candidatus Aenigmarchaeota archaeon ex4484_56]
MIGIIGGTGIYDLFGSMEEVKINTPYGNPSDNLFVKNNIVFLPRHGRNHTIPPHKINYRANIWALKELGVERIISSSAVGSLKEEFKPGELAIVTQFIDFTKKRDYTFFDGGKVAHISMAEPFCEELNKLAYEVGKKLNIKIHRDSTVVVIEGPRFSTKSESNMFRQYASLINMTIVPECILAREMEMCYCSIAMITDYDCWKEQIVSAEEVSRKMKENIEKTKNLINELIKVIPKERKCICKDALKDAFI